ncbi:MAG: hypothetical protein HYY29_03590 [Chloroflexi bacterium]|nr:hypothetical protein [Chloroflexota bacterium]
MFQADGEKKQASLLEKQIEDGEKWLTENVGRPSYERGLARYWERVAAYVALKEGEEREQNIKAVWLDLPPGSAYQKTGCESVHSQVRVLFHGQPAAENEVSRSQLGALLSDRREVLELAGRQRAGRKWPSTS